MRNHLLTDAPAKSFSSIFCHNPLWWEDFFQINYAKNLWRESNLEGQKISGKTIIWLQREFWKQGPETRIPLNSGKIEVEFPTKICTPPSRCPCSYPTLCGNHSTRWSLDCPFPRTIRLSMMDLHTLSMLQCHQHQFFCCFHGVFNLCITCFHRAHMPPSFMAMKWYVT